MTKAIFQLEPLTCPSCVNKIETILSRTDGIESAKVLFNSSKVKTVFDESQLTATQIEEKLTKLGYPVLSSRTSQG